MADDSLLAELANRLVDRVADVTRRFPCVLDLGGRHGPLARALRIHDPETEVVVAEPSAVLAAAAPVASVVMDLERLPFADASFDAVVSAGSLQWVNDLPGLLVQIRHVLRPDGLLLAAFPGGDTLIELRQALLAAELDVSDGASPRVAPFVDVRDLGALLQRAGFVLPVVDVDRVVLTYPDPLQLLREIRHAGEANLLRGRGQKPLSRRVLARTFERYAAEHVDHRGRLQVTVDLLFATGWSPAPNQPQPARRGTGTVNLAKAMGVDPAILDGTRKAGGGATD